MTDTHAAENLFNLLDRWSSDEDLRESGKVRLLCHQPQNGDLAYLHRLYPGLGSAQMEDLEAVIDHQIPRRLRDFYGLTNGLRLFEGQVSVSGLVKDFSRDPYRPIPICIEQGNRLFASVRPQWHQQGFFRIGGVSFIRQDELICGPDDCVIVLNAESGEPLRNYSDIFDFLVSFTKEMAQFWTSDGKFIGDWEVIDQLLLGVAGKA